jgi:hypothetical protein
MRITVPAPLLVIVVNNGPDVDIHVTGGDRDGRYHAVDDVVKVIDHMRLQALGDGPADLVTGWRVVNFNHPARLTYKHRTGSALRGSVDGARDVADLLEATEQWTVVLGRAP